MNANANGEAKQTPYALLGGASGLRQIVDRFYALMDSSPDFTGLWRLHAADLSQARELLFEFLSGWLGGPPLYFQRPEHRCVASAHRRFAIGPVEVEEWLACMKRAFREQGVDETLQNQIGPALTRVAEGLRNRDGR